MTLNCPCSGGQPVRQGLVCWRQFRRKLLLHEYVPPAGICVLTLLMPFAMATMQNATVYATAEARWCAPTASTPKATLRAGSDAMSASPPRPGSPPCVSVWSRAECLPFPALSKPAAGQRACFSHPTAATTCPAVNSARHPTLGCACKQPFAGYLSYIQALANPKWEGNCTRMLTHS